MSPAQSSLLASKPSEQATAVLLTILWIPHTLKIPKGKPALLIHLYPHLFLSPVVSA